MISKPEIIGYRALSQEEISLMNSIKLLAQSVGTQVAMLESTANVDQRWVAIAKTDLQKGFMTLIRAVAQPTTF